MNFKNLILIAFSILCFTQKSKAQVSDELFRKITYLDSSLFATIYTCNPEKNIKFLTEDFEFFHDKGGLTSSRKLFMEALQKNYCKPNDYKTRRELVKESMKVFPIPGYGVLQTGEHYFYETYKTENEKLVGVAKFAQIWKNENGDWKLSRVISYDHQPATEKTKH